jgi:hypothetical protein
LAWPGEGPFPNGAGSQSLDEIGQARRIHASNRAGSQGLTKSIWPGERPRFQPWHLTPACREVFDEMVWLRESRFQPASLDEIGLAW